MRFRLTVTYLLMFSLMLTALGFLFRTNLSTTLDSQANDLLEEEWSAALAYLTFENQRPVWAYDRVDPDESAIVTRLQRVYLLTDDSGHVLQRSETYQMLGVDSPEFIAEVLKHPEPIYRTLVSKQGVRYRLKSARIVDKKHYYYLSLGRPLDLSDGTLRQFTLNYFVALPGLILITGLLGWLLAGRALGPVNDVSLAAQRITGSSLEMRIPLRGAGDELDHLIETFNNMMDRLKSSFDQIRQFSTDVSHELRTPLTAIRGQIEVALMTAESPDQFREAMEKALEDVERLSNIVRALLLLS
ncbi:MAG: histidine kinase dimerization/phospho-acceptor domain-containing protein, partial [Bryobacteraceae bacterium]